LKIDDSKFQINERSKNRSKNKIDMTNPLPGNTGNGKFLRVMDTNIDDPLVRNLLLTLGNHGK